MPPTIVYKSFADYDGKPLVLKSKNFWDTIHELTDGENCYASIGRPWFLSSEFEYTSASASFTTIATPAWEFVLKEKNGDTVLFADSYSFKVRTDLKLKQGFEAIFSKPFYSAKYYTVTDKDNNQIFDIDKQRFGPISVGIYKPIAEIPDFEILLFGSIVCGLNCNER